ncbi:proton-coupled amino acid transporter-like protein CG1139 isoform X1 [Drosophila sulfurigaster albostrigata]|uniref:proton-coupled amino acid transporter-like protein CG1139 isoform X1 n=2 Tax=Drosophila sulfurigaster albostrigata TaxID=89887 RepID=UPI002D218E52|nr:proton-coupled amino acid transporter-like protein CG1139 isoform X1 [Drosophila sulfurigaster albostrigata]
MKNDSNDDYDPHEHRDVKKPTNNWQTMVHFLKASVGTGVLAMPNAFAHAGYLNGSISTVLLGCIALYCLHILLGSMYILCKRKRVPYISYSECMEIGLKEGPPIFQCLIPLATPIVDGFLAFYHYGICCIYVVFMASNIKQVVDHNLIVWPVRTHMCFLVIPLLLIFSIRNLKLLAPFCAAANILLLFGLSIVMYYICTELPPLSEREMLVDIRQMPVFFGTVLFALEAVGVILAIEENMATPKSYVTPCGIMNWGMAIVLTLYATIGFFGYWRYGNEVLGSVTLNLPQTDILPQCVKILFAVTTYISYALQGYVAANIIWNKYLIKHFPDESKHTRYELIMRAVIVILTFLAAVAIPDLGLFLSLVGALCLSILGLMCPALLQICIQYEQGYGRLKYKLVINILLFMFGAFGGFVGTFVSVEEIIDTYACNKAEI